MDSFPCWEMGVLETSTISRKHFHIVLRDKFNTHLKETKKKGVSIFFEKYAKTFFRFKIILEERERKRGLRKRFEKCQIGRFLWI